MRPPLDYSRDPEDWNDYPPISPYEEAKAILWVFIVGPLLTASIIAAVVLVLWRW